MLTTTHVAGDPRVFHREAKSLARGGHKVTYITPFIQGRSPGLYEGVEIVGIKEVPISRRLSRPIQWIRLFKAARSQAFDAYHVHDFDLLVIGLILKLVTRRFLIYDSHEHTPDAISLKTWIPTLLRGPLRFLVDRFELLLSRFADGIVVADEKVAERFRAHSTVVVLQNFPILDFFNANRDARTSADLVFVGGLSKTAGVWTALETLRVLVQEKRRRVTLLLVGRLHDRRLKEEIQSYVTKHALQNSLTIIDEIPHEQIAAQIRGAQIGLVTLSSLPKFRKNIPQKMFEYMACGVPVVASDLPTTRPFIEDARCGLLVDGSDPQGFAAAVTQLLDDPALRCAMARNGREAVERIYNWQVMEQRLWDLYRVLDARRRPR